MLHVVNNLKLFLIKSKQNKLNRFELLGNKKMFTSKRNDELDKIVWIDMEMTGLDIKKNHILEVACIITDKNLNIIAESPNLILHQPKEILDNMNVWCKKQHSKTGLIEESFKSNLNYQKVEEILLEFFMKNINQGICPLAGNSIYMDRMFLNHFMPKLNNYLHYRIIDVSTIKELCRRWNNDIFQQLPKKEFRHRALDDIKESINELKYYKCNFFKL